MVPGQVATVVPEEHIIWHTDGSADLTRIKSRDQNQHVRKGILKQEV